MEMMRVIPLEGKRQEAARRRRIDTYVYVAAGPPASSWLVLGATYRSIEAHCSVVNLGNRRPAGAETIEASTRANERVVARLGAECGLVCIAWPVGSSGRVRWRARGRPAVRPTPLRGGAHTAGVRACCCVGRPGAHTHHTDSACGQPSLLDRARAHYSPRLFYGDVHRY